jgi:AcrR family transcriptional regulator
VALDDARAQLFAAAERILLREGPNRLTSRDVTDEAGCAKGVLHRYFDSLDRFLAEFVLDRTSWLDTQAVMLAGSAGLGDVADTVTDALVEMLDPTRTRIVHLVMFRPAVRELLRERWLTGVPVLTDVAYAVAGYLQAEQRQGRIELAAPAETVGRAVAGLAYQLLADGPADDRARLRGDVAALLRQAAARRSRR